MKRKYYAAIGQQFGRLTVTGPEVRKSTASDPGGRPFAPCVCDCGRERLVLVKSLGTGRTQSCGHHGVGDPTALIAASRSTEGRARAARRAGSPESRDRLRAWAQTDEGRAHIDRMAKSPERLARATKHGLWKHPLYKTWVSMIHRCHDTGDVAYPRYGGRGISVCPAWRDDVAAFIAWMDANLGPRPEGQSLDRIDNDGNYEPGNLRWATSSEQRRNQRARQVT